MRSKPSERSGRSRGPRGGEDSPIKCAFVAPRRAVKFPRFSGKVPSAQNGLWRRVREGAVASRRAEFAACRESPRGGLADTHRRAARVRGGVAEVTEGRGAGRVVPGSPAPSDRATPCFCGGGRRRSSECILHPKLGTLSTREERQRGVNTGRAGDSQGPEGAPHSNKSRRMRKRKYKICRNEITLFASAATIKPRVYPRTTHKKAELKT